MRREALGAAWGLLAEHRDGYPHRLRAIGHLHEAKDESQEWPELHDSIRDARKAYQKNGTMLDFEALANLMAFHRSSPGNAPSLVGPKVWSST